MPSKPQTVTKPRASMAASTLSYTLITTMSSPVRAPPPMPAVADTPGTDIRIGYTR